MRFLYSFAILVCIIPVIFSSEESTKHGAASRKGDHFKDGLHNSVFDQEALLGSHKMDELADLPDDVRIVRLTNLAKSHDANQNGIIESDELKNWILQSFKMLDREEAMEKFDEEDGNEDDKINFDEVLGKQYGYREADLEEMQKADLEDDEKEVLQVIADDKKRFETADLDKDGFLNRDEYVAYYQPYDYPHMFEVELEKAMKDFDKDKDGSVSIEEFIGEAHADDEEYRQAEMTNFEELDKDKDGKLNPEELKPWAIPDNSEIADEEVQHLLNMCDEDKDGHLSIDEIVAKEDEFIGSSATDYGRTLHFVKDEL